jgi:peroxiredoxin
MDTNAPETAEKNERKLVSPLLIFVIFPFLGLFAALAVMLSGGAESNAAATPLPVRLPSSQQWNGESAPGFELLSLEETTINLSNYRGRAVFLNFWATWCEPCARELPAFEEFMAEQDANGAVVLAVNMGESAEHVRSWLETRHIDGFPVLLDIDYDVSDQYGVGPIPVTHLLDENGVIRFSKYGEMSRAEMDGYLAELAAES